MLVKKDEKLLNSFNATQYPSMSPKRLGAETPTIPNTNESLWRLQMLRTVYQMNVGDYVHTYSIEFHI